MEQLDQKEAKKDTVGFERVEEHPELDKAIELANFYIEKCSEHFTDLLENFEEDFPGALRNAPNIRFEDLDAREIGYTPISEQRPKYIVLNTKYTNLLETLKDNGRAVISMEDPDFMAISFFVGIGILHEFCHVMVRYRTGERKTPLKLRKQHRGERVDAGKSVEIQLFGGLFRLVEQESKFKLAFDVTFPADRVWVDNSVVFKIFNEGKLTFQFYDKEDPRFKEFRLGSADKIWNHSEKDDLITEEDLVDPLEDTNESVLRDLHADPRTTRILDDWKAPCMRPLKKK
jgi:hypothetical protein